MNPEESKSGKFAEKKRRGGEEGISFKTGRNKTGQLVLFCLLQGEVQTEIHTQLREKMLQFVVHV